MSLYAELKRRNVFRVAAAYIVLGWLLLPTETSPTAMAVTSAETLTTGWGAAGSGAAGAGAGDEPPPERPLTAAA